MSKLLRIDLNARSHSLEPLPAAYAGLGGRGLTSAIVAAEVPAGADPLGPDNLLVIAPGLLAATSLPNSGRLSVGARSPLTGTIKEANSGGSAAQKLARLGIAAVVLKGISARPAVLHIGNSGVSFGAADALWGLGNYATVERLRAEDRSAGLITVGPAGEKGLKSAAVCVTAPDDHLRTAARGGLGAVMGRKRVKALLIDDADAPGVEVRDPEKLKQAAKAIAEGIAAHPFVGGLQAFGTSKLVGLINELGALPTRNYSSGSFEGAGRISGEALAKILGERKGSSTKHHCMSGCIVWCSQVYTDENGEFLTSGLEYETLGLVGSNCAIDDLDAIARIDRACDDLGLDTMEVGAALAVAMEAGRLPWGDGARALGVLESIREDDPFGLLIASGCVETGRALGVNRVPAVKGQSLAAYDPRVFKGTGVTYATCPMGADHTAGNAMPNPSYDPRSPHGQNQKSESLQCWFAAIDSLGICLFASAPLAQNPELQAKLVDAVSAKLGEELASDYLLALGRRICRLEKDFNRRAGFGAKNDRLPSFFSEEELPPHGGTWDISDQDLDSVFA